MHTIHHQSAKANFNRRGSRLSIGYSGLLGPQEFLSLRMGVLANMAEDTTNMVLCFEKAALGMGRMPVYSKTGYKFQSAAIICRPDQLAIFNAYADELETIGVERMVFLESEIALAHEWSALRLDRRATQRGRRPASPVALELPHPQYA